MTEVLLMYMYKLIHVGDSWIFVKNFLIFFWVLQLLIVILWVGDSFHAKC